MTISSGVGCGGKLVWCKAFGAELIAVSNPGNVNKYNASTNSFVGFTTLPQPALDTRATGTYLIITTASVVYNKQLSLIRQINNNQIPDYSPVFF
jgi:hypothetical protein